MFKFTPRILIALLAASVFIASPSLAADNSKSKKAKTRAQSKIVAPSAKKPSHMVSSRVKHVKTKQNKKIVYQANSQEPQAQSYSQEMGLHRTPDPLALNTGSALVMNASTREIIYAKNADTVLPIASITKLMTSLVTLESQPNMDEMIEVSQDDVDTYKHSQSRLKVGDQLTRREMMQVALMSSENRAANSLARSYPLGYEAFIKAMNDKAASIGMTQTKFMDPTGLSEKNQSSAMDLAKLVEAANKHSQIREWTTTLDRDVEVGGRHVMYRNSNPLVRSGAWDIVLQKTGYIKEAGRCVVMEFTSSGRKFVMVLLDSLSSQTRMQDAHKLQKYTLAKVG